MRISVLAVGGLTEAFWRQACAEYLKRLSRYAKVTVTEVADVSQQQAGSAAAVRQQEAANLLGRLQRQTDYYALDAAGELLTSEGLAALLEQQATAGDPEACFVIGGSHGLAPELLQTARRTLSFGRITLPHNLARVVLLEQLYRSFRIIRHEPYHK